MTDLQIILSIAGTLGGGGLLLSIYKVSQWLPQRNTKKIDCVEGDIGKIQIHIARIDQKQTGLKENIEKMDTNLQKVLDANGRDMREISGKLDKLLKLNGGG